MRRDRFVWRSHVIDTAEEIARHCGRGAWIPVNLNGAGTVRDSRGAGPKQTNKQTNKEFAELWTCLSVGGRTKKLMETIATMVD